MASPVTLFIVEGESRDLRFAEKMKDLFLKGRDDLRVICLPAAQNIYMLYERLAEEDFDLDVVEVLRETVPSAAKCLEGVERDSVSACSVSMRFHLRRIESWLRSMRSSARRKGCGSRTVRCLCYRLFQSFCSTISVISSLIPWLRCATLSSMIAPEEMDETQLISRVQVLLSKL